MCVNSGNMVNSSTLLEPAIEGLELRDAPYQQPHQLVQVFIEFSDLIGVENEGIGLFADATTTAKLVPQILLSLFNNAHTILQGPPQWVSCKTWE